MPQSVNEHPSYVPSELVNSSPNTCDATYHCYLIELKQDFEYSVSVHDIVLAIRTKLDSEIIDAASAKSFDVETGKLSVNLRYVETIHVSPNQVEKCRRFQTALFRILLNRDVNKLPSVSDDFSLGDKPEIDYLLLPATVTPSNSIIDWNSVSSFPFSSETTCDCKDHAPVRTKNGSVCSCKLENCVVYTPQIDSNPIFIINGTTEYNGNSIQKKKKRGKGTTTLKRYGSELHSAHQSLLNARSVFKVGNYLLKGRQKKKEKGLSLTTGQSNPDELPPELCYVIMSPISIRTIYSFSFIPSVMHWLESLLVAFNLKKMLLDHCTLNDIPIRKILQAITAKGCQEALDYDSLETLGDSFLKYAVSQQLFKTNQNCREGPLSKEREKMTSNVALSKYGCSRKLPGFIRIETFEPKKWDIPGDKSKGLLLDEELVSNRTRGYFHTRREVNSDIVADVVEALIGALNTENEEAALSFINWIGIKVDTYSVPYERHISIVPEKLVKVKFLESQLKYSFQDPYLLVEALTHSSFKGPEIPRCYERLEFLGDAVLDYLFTTHFYNEYPDKLSPKFLTNMRSISVNNEHYALSAINAKLDEHILCDSVVTKQIADTMKGVEIEKLSSKSTFGWELETYFCKALADVIESIAGAIFVDSGYKKEVVFQVIKPLLEPLVTPETAKRHHISELHELCQKNHYEKEEDSEPHDKNETSFTIKVKADGKPYEHTAKASNKDTARKLASKEVLKLLKICRPLG